MEMWATFLLSISFIIPTFAFPEEVHKNLENRTEYLDSQQRFKVTWEICTATQTAYFYLEVQTRGYIIFGLSNDVRGNDSDNFGTDLVIGGINMMGFPYFEDRHGIGNFSTIKDAVQNWNFLGGKEEGNVTFFNFSRPLNTCDGKDDISISNNTQKFVWAMGKTDDIDGEAEISGSYLVHILDKPTQQHFDVSKYEKINFAMKIAQSKDTTKVYMMHKIQKLDSKRYIVAMVPNVTENIHHFSVYYCNPPSSIGKTKPKEIFETFAKLGVVSGETSKTINKLKDVQEHCQDVLYFWTSGAGNTYMPENVGYELPNLMDYYLMEVHLQNEEKQNEIKASAEVTFFLTKANMPIEAGLLTLEKKDDFLIIPPTDSKSLSTVAGFCSTECTKQLNHGGVTIFNVQLQSHRLGSRLRLRHFRKGVELPYIAADEQYTSKFQESRNIEPVKVLPGDELMIECSYNNSQNNAPVFGGDSISEEKCSSLIYYWPKDGLVSCSSGSVAESVFDLFGVHNWKPTNQGDPNPIIYSTNVSPNGVPFQEYLKSGVHWTPGLKEAVAYSQVHGQQLGHCKFVHPNSRQKYTFKGVGFPKNVEEYKTIPLDVCATASIKSSSFRTCIADISIFSASIIIGFLVAIL